MKKIKVMAKKIIGLSLAACLCMPTGLVKAEEIGEEDVEIESITEEEQEYSEDTFADEEVLTEEVGENDGVLVDEALVVDDEEIEIALCEENTEEDEEELSDYEELKDKGSAEVDRNELQKLYKALDENDNMLTFNADNRGLNSNAWVIISKNDDGTIKFCYEDIWCDYFYMDIDLNNKIKNTVINVCFISDNFNNHKLPSLSLLTDNNVSVLAQYQVDTDYTKLNNKSNFDFECLYLNEDLAYLIRYLTDEKMRNEAQDKIRESLLIFKVALLKYDIDIGKLGFQNGVNDSEHFTCVRNDSKIINNVTAQRWNIGSPSTLLEEECFLEYNNKKMNDTKFKISAWDTININEETRKNYYDLEDYWSDDFDPIIHLRSSEIEKDYAFNFNIEEMYIGSEADNMAKAKVKNYIKPSDNQQWIFVKVKVENFGKYNIDSFDFALCKDDYSSFDVFGKVVYDDSYYYNFYNNHKNDRYEEFETINPNQSKYFWLSVLADKGDGYPNLICKNCYVPIEDSYYYKPGQLMSTDPNFFVKSDGVISTSGIYCARNYPSIQAGINIQKSDESDTVEYRWVACNNNEPDKWFEVSPWTKNNNWMDWTPDKSGGYVFVCYARVVGNEDASQIQCAFGTEYHKAIKGICQMPYTGPGGGYLIGIESYDNPNHSYKYEMLILDCNLYVQGKDAWVYDTGKCGAAENCLWTIWQPQYGYYWTLFRIYDANDNLIDEACYGFENVY